MNLQISKIELAKIVLDIENPKLIEEIILLIQSKDTLTEKQKSAIDEALYSLDKGEGIPHNMVMEETKSRYSKYFK